MEQVDFSLKVDSQNRILILEDKYRQSAIEILTKSFCDSEPVTRYAHIQHADFYPFAEEVIDRAIKDKMGMIALDENDHVTACVISEDLAKPFKPHFEKYPRMHLIFSVLDQLLVDSLRNKTLKPGKVIHMWLAGVAPGVRAKGLYTAVGLEGIKLAINRGYCYAYSDFTSPYSEKIVAHFPGLELCSKLTYDDFNYKGERPFKGLEGGAASYIAPIVPGAKLEACYESIE